METHVKVLGAIQIVCGVIGLLAAVFFVVVFGGVASLVGTSGDPDASIAVPIIGLTGMALVAVVTLLSLPALIVGAGLLNRKAWARIGGIVISIFALILIPFGTIVGAYGLWVLFSKDTEQLFLANRADSMVAEIK